MDIYLPKGTSVTDLANDSLKEVIESLEEELDEVYGIAQDLLDDLRELQEEEVDDKYGNIILSETVNELIKRYESELNL